MVFRNVPEVPGVGRVTWFMELGKGLEFFSSVVKYGKVQEKNQDNLEKNK